jgi:hypothetical protein
LFGRWSAASKFRVGLDTKGFKFGSHMVQVSLSLLNLLAGRVRAIPLGHGTRRRMEKHDATFHKLCELLGVIIDCSVGRSDIQRHENRLVHRCSFCVRRGVIPQ